MQECALPYACGAWAKAIVNVWDHGLRPHYKGLAGQGLGEFTNQVLYQLSYTGTCRLLALRPVLRNSRSVAPWRYVGPVTAAVPGR